MRQNEPLSLDTIKEIVQVMVKYEEKICRSCRCYPERQAYCLSALYKIGREAALSGVVIP